MTSLNEAPVTAHAFDRALDVAWTWVRTFSISRWWWLNQEDGTWDSDRCVMPKWDDIERMLS